MDEIISKIFQAEENSRKQIESVIQEEKDSLEKTAREAEAQKEKAKSEIVKEYHQKLKNAVAQARASRERELGELEKQKEKITGDQNLMKELRERIIYILTG